MKRRYAPAAAAVAAALLAAGCASTHQSAGLPSVEKPNLTVAAVPAVDTAGLYIAQQDGLFAAQGLKVNIVPGVSSATVIAGQLSGKYDVTDGNYVSYILADAQDHANLQVLAAASIMGPSNQELAVPAGSPIKTIAGLKGKKIAVNVLNNIGTLLIGALLRDSGMTLSQVQLVAMPFPDMATALKQHKVDAAWLPQPFLAGAEETVGAEPLADLDVGATQGLPIAGYVVTRAWEQKYPRTAAAFRRAIVAGQRIADTDPSAVQDAMMRYSGQPVTAVAVMAAPVFPLNTDPALLQRVSDLMLQTSLLSRPYNAMQMTG